jgi:hypothetical protein
VWSHLVAERLRARFSGQFRIVALAYPGGGGLAAVGLVVVSLFIPATALVRETLSLPLAQLVDQWLQAAAGRGVPAFWSRHDRHPRCSCLTLAQLRRGAFTGSPANYYARRADAHCRADAASRAAGHDTAARNNHPAEIYLGSACIQQVPA